MFDVLNDYHNVFSKILHITKFVYLSLRPNWITHFNIIIVEVELDCIRVVLVKSVFLIHLAITIVLQQTIGLVCSFDT